MKKLIALLLSLVMVFTAAAALADLTFVTGGQTGTYFAFGTVLANYITNNTDVKVTAIAGNGSADNIDALDMEDDQIAFVQNDVAYYAYNGIRFERYEGKAVTSFRALASLYTETVQLVTCNPDIKSVADINPQYLSFGDSTEALKDGKIDAAFVVAGSPTTAVADLFTSKQGYLVSLDEEHIAKLQEISSAYTKSIIAADTYTGQAEDTVTVGIKATIIANSQVSDDEAYTIVKTIFEGKEEITASHAKGAELDLEYASTCGLPYHPGAAKYFAEQGITVETAE